MKKNEELLRAPTTESDSTADPRGDDRGGSRLTGADAFAQLCDILKEAGAVPRIGLVQQGKYPRVHEMYLAGESWEAIGKAIGWAPDAAKEWYERESAHTEERAFRAALTAYGQACFSRATQQRIENLKIDALIAHDRVIAARLKHQQMVGHVHLDTSAKLELDR